MTGTQPAGSPKKKRHIGRWILAGFGALVAIIIATSLAKTTSTPATRSAPSASTVAPAPAAATSAPVVTEAAAVGSWYASITTDFQAIQTDQGSIGSAASAGDLAGLQVACGQMKTDVVTFEADPAAPDAAIRTDLAKAMDDYSTGASQCLSSDLTSSAASMNAGTGWIDKATTRVNVIAAGG